MSNLQRRKRQIKLELLEERQCLSSVGWDGPGQGSAELTYYISDAPSYLNQADVELAIETALEAWADVIDVEFSETSTPNLRNSIDFQFTRIDGRNGTLAQAYFPDDVNRARIAGDVQFDSSETWEIGNSHGGSAFDLMLVAAHEIGHSLGIEHIHGANTVLGASVSPYQSFSRLWQVDIDAALALCAAAPVATIDNTVELSGAIESTPTTVPTTVAVNPTTNAEPNARTNEPSELQNRWSRRFIRWARWNHFRWHTNSDSSDADALAANNSDDGSWRPWLQFRFSGRFLRPIS